MPSIRDKNAEIELVREHYREREKNLKADHHRELSSVKSNHKEQTERKEYVHSEKINKAQLKRSEDLNRKDMQHFNQMERMRRASLHDKKRSSEKQRQELAQLKEQHRTQRQTLEERHQAESSRDKTSVRQMEAQRHRDQQKHTREKEKSLNALRDADNRAFEVMFEERSGMVKEYNRINHEEINEAHLQADKRVNRNYANFQKKMENLEEDNDHRYQKRERQLTGQINTQRQESQLNRDLLESRHQDEREQLLRTQDNQTKGLKNHHQGNLKELRISDQKKRDNLEQVFEQRYQKSEERHQLEVKRLKTDYEQQIKKLKEEQASEIARLKRENEVSSTQKDKSFDLHSSTQDVRNQRRVRNLKDHYEQRIQEMDLQYKNNLAELIRLGQKMDSHKI